MPFIRDAEAEPATLKYMSRVVAAVSDTFIYPSISSNDPPVTLATVAHFPFTTLWLSRELAYETVPEPEVVVLAYVGRLAVAQAVSLGVEKATVSIPSTGMTCNAARPDLAPDVL